MCFTDMSLSLFMLSCIVVSQNKHKNLNVMKTIFFVLFAMLICACSNESKNDAFKVRRIDLSELSFNSSLKLSSFAESIEIIPLETTSQSLIGEIRKIYYRNGRYYMLVTNGLSNARALVFTEQGKFLYELDRIGQGKGEYIEMGTFVLLPNANIKVLGWNKTVTYDSVGNYLYESPMTYYAHDAVVFSDGSYVLRHHIVIDGYLYAPISPTVLINGYTNSKQNMSSKEWNEFRNRHTYLVDICENISEEDNPVLLRIKLKKIE